MSASRSRRPCSAASIQRGAEEARGDYTQMRKQLDQRLELEQSRCGPARISKYETRELAV
jgi:hypothetical protein